MQVKIYIPVGDFRSGDGWLVEGCLLIHEIQEKTDQQGNNPQRSSKQQKFSPENLDG